MARTFYAVKHAEVTMRDGSKDPITTIHQFQTVAERQQFIARCRAHGFAAIETTAHDPRVKRARRYAGQGIEWPVAV